MDTEKRSDLDNILGDIDKHVDGCKAASVPCNAEVLLKLLVKAAGSLREVKAVADLAHANSVKALEQVKGLEQHLVKAIGPDEHAVEAYRMARQALDAIAVLTLKAAAKPAAVKKPAAKKAAAKKAA